METSKIEKLETLAIIAMALVSKPPKHAEMTDAEYAKLIQTLENGFKGGIQEMFEDRMEEMSGKVASVLMETMKEHESGPFRKDANRVDIFA